MTVLCDCDNCPEGTCGCTCHKLDAFNKRIEEKKLAEEKAETEKAEKLRQDYLSRTGRTEMKP
jgi:hypothetical protein